MNRNLLIQTISLLSFLMFIVIGTYGQDVVKDIKTESIEDFETGDFSLYEWEFGGNADWEISTSDPYEGLFCAKSGIINHSQTSTLFLSYEVYEEQDITFWYKVSSESNFDYLKFYIDGDLQDEWSGTVPWSEASFPVPLGFHTFTWEYYKDGSVTTGEDACWIDFITFPPEEITANFIADTTVICLTDVVFFTDLSIGPVTEWNWVFEGAVPGTSTEQNPVVAYSQLGEWDVFLEVSDGIETSVHYMPAYINVSTTPDAAPTPVGITSLCASWGNTTYNTTAMGGDVISYDWQIDPMEAATISGNGSTNVTVVWDPDWLGVADLYVAGINYCGIGTFSDPLVITRYLPDVSVMLPNYVGLPEPAFELTGGSPSGGTYSGPGVSNGWFDPAAAGMGPHIIVYSYTDVNFCENSASDTITVTEFIGIDEFSAGSELSVFPNPNNGTFVIQMDIEYSFIANVSIYNTMNEVVFKESNVEFNQGFQKKLNLNDLSKGIYFIQISGKNKEYIKKIIVQN